MVASGNPRRTASSKTLASGSLSAKRIVKDAGVWKPFGYRKPYTNLSKLGQNINLSNTGSYTYTVAASATRYVAIFTRGVIAAVTATVNGVGPLFSIGARDGAEFLHVWKVTGSSISFAMSNGSIQYHAAFTFELDNTLVASNVTRFNTPATRPAYGMLLGVYWNQGSGATASHGSDNMVGYALTSVSDGPNQYYIAAATSDIDTAGTATSFTFNMSPNTTLVSLFAFTLPEL
jgi:hypothetical protein